MRAGASTAAATTVVDVGDLSLQHLASQAPNSRGVRASDLEPGDWVIVRTKNSTYVLRANSDGTFEASGGWFGRAGRSGQRTVVAGCTWGGSALLTNMIAAPGMYLEFANRVTTTRIRAVRHVRPVAPPQVH